MLGPLVTALSAWVAQGGVLIGVNEPTAVPGWGDYFRMARALGVDEDTGARVCHGRWPVQADLVEGLIPEGATLCTRDHLYLTDGETRVLAEQDGLRMCLVPGCPPPCGHQQHRTSTDHRHPHTGGRCAG